MKFGITKIMLAGSLFITCVSQAGQDLAQSYEDLSVSELRDLMYGRIKNALRSTKSMTESDVYAALQSCRRGAQEGAPYVADFFYNFADVMEDSAVIIVRMCDFMEANVSRLTVKQMKVIKRIVYSRSLDLIKVIEAYEKCLKALDAFGQNFEADLKSKNVDCLQEIGLEFAGFIESDIALLSDDRQERFVRWGESLINFNRFVLSKLDLPTTD